jgi:hypothetical protein
MLKVTMEAHEFLSEARGSRDVGVDPCLVSDPGAKALNGGRQGMITGFIMAKPLRSSLTSFWP